ncbi:YkuS family protein [Thermoactinomyces vulgaris]|nr:YkuS family protein [Thermoactinomyces vulgaris]
MKRVAVEAGLSPVRDYLSQRGFQVEEYQATAKSR